MIKLRYSKNELDLQGNNNSLQSLYDVITHINLDEISFQTQINFDPSPYEHVLKGILIKKSDELLNLKVEKELLDLFQNKQGGQDSPTSHEL